MPENRMKKIESFVICALFLIMYAGCGDGDPGVNRSKNQTDTSQNDLQKINQCIASDLENPDLYNVRARYYLVDRKIDLALRDINTAISLNEREPAYYLTLSDIQLLSGQTKNCLDAINKALSLEPENQQALLKLGKLCLIIQDYPGVFRTVNQLISLDPVNPQAYFIRGIALLEKGDTNSAIGAMLKATDQDQQYFEAYFQLGELYSIKKDPLAASFLRNAVRLAPENIEAKYLLAMFYQENEQYDEAIQTYNQISLLDSLYAKAPYNTGYIYLVYLNDYQQAIHFFSRAVRANPDYADAYYNRGLAYEMNNEPEQAYRDYHQTLEIRVNHPQAIEGLNRLDAKKIR